MARLAELSYRARKLLVALGEHAHLPAKNGFRRPGITRCGKTRYPIVTYASVGPLYRLGLITLGDVAPGMKGVVLTAEGQRLRREIDAERPAPKPAPQAAYWWTDP